MGIAPTAEPATTTRSAARTTNNRGRIGSLLPNLVFRYSSEFGKGNAIESDAGWDGDVETFQYRRHQIYRTKARVGKSHAGRDRDFHMFRNETAMTRPVLRDLPGPPEIGPRRGCENEITSARSPKQLEQLAGCIRHVGFPRSRQELSIVEL